MSKSVRYKGKNNNTIVYSKGMSDRDIIDVISKRIEKRQIELDKRKWIYDEYLSLSEKQKVDKSWLSAFSNGFTIEKK